jgi:hypothetical protein
MKEKTSRPKDTPMFKKNLIQKEFLELKDIREQLKDIQGNISSKEKTAYGDDEEDDEEREKAFSGIVFIVLKQPK